MEYKVNNIIKVLKYLEIILNNGIHKLKYKSNLIEKKSKISFKVILKKISLKEFKSIINLLKIKIREIFLSKVENIKILSNFLTYHKLHLILIKR